jgi:general secretion pathway protein A
MDSTLHSPDEMAGYLGFLMHRRRVESNVTLVQHFGFQEDPFRVNPDARYMFPSKTHLQALAALENGFYSNRGFIAMIAPPGMGKTTLLYRFLEDTRQTARSVFLFDIDSDCEPRDFVGYILRDFGITPAKSSSEMHQQLGDALIKETEQGRKCVVVIDEAQNLSDAVLERVRLLTNFETSQGKLLQIILSGQPQLTDKLLQASLVQLRQRVSTICRLDLLTKEETVDYIDYRLRQAGYDGDPLFTEDALRLIAEASLGTPRMINNLCYNALSLCSTMQSRQVDGDMAEKAIANLQLFPHLNEASAAGSPIAGQELAATKPWMQVQRALMFWGQAMADHVKVVVPAVAALVILCVLGVLRFNEVGASQSRMAGEERVMNLKAATESVVIPPVAKPRKVTPPKPTSITKAAEPGNAAAHRNSGSPSAIPHGATPPRTSAAELSRSMAAGANPVGSVTGSQSGPAAAAAIPTPATLNIDSVPHGADIEIDGAFVGNTPSMVSIAPGNHQIAARKKGFASWTRSLNVTGGAIHLNAELEKEVPKVQR